MAIVAHFIWRSMDTGSQQVDGVTGMVLAIDDAVDTTDALVQARAVTVANDTLANDGAALNLPAGYFDNNRAIATVYDAAGDVSLIADKQLLLDFIAP